MTKTKRVGLAGKFGPRYGKKIRKLVVETEKRLKAKKICPYCKKFGSIRRVAVGIWNCKKCNKTFTGKAYYLE